MKSILVVEDRASVREFVVETLRDIGGYDVDESPDTSALEMAKEKDYDAYLVDLYLQSGDMTADGFSLIREIRKIRPHARIIIMTGKSITRHVEEAVLVLGITDFLAKPITLKDLLAKVRKVLR